MNYRLATAAGVLGSAFLGGLVSRSILEDQRSVHASPASPLPIAQTGLDASTEFGLGRLDEVVRKVAPSVVTVDALRPPANATARAKPVEDSGSGMVVRLAGQRGCFVLTNNHVVGGAKPGEITVTLADGRILMPEKAWFDPESDVAVLQLADDNLPTLELADSDRVRVGQWVLAFGSPFGMHKTVTHGIISGRDRGQISLGPTIRIKEFLQTDAPINPGNSGGPLVDLAGNVVGINTAIATNTGSNSGVSFSIPANLVKRVARELLDKGAVSRGYLGLQLAPTLEPLTALRLGLTNVRGAMVEGVHPEGPAGLGGLQQGDVVLKLDAIDVRDENHLINLVSALPVSQKVRVTVWRGRQTRELGVTVGDWAASVATKR